MFTRTIIAILFSIVFAATANAEINVTFGGWSYHVQDRDIITNEDHKLLGLSYVNENNGWGGFAARFDNSFDRESYALGVAKYWSVSDFIVGIQGGAVYGYTSCMGNEGDKSVWCPMVVPSISYAKWDLQPTIMLMGPAVVFAFSYSF